MAKDSADTLEAFLDALLDRFADRLAAGLARRPAAAPRPAPAAKRSGRKGAKLDMSCRVPGCKNRSRGPRFGFICDEHGKKLSKEQQAAVRAAWNAKKKA